MNNSDFLFARPSLFGGMARLFDWGGTLKEYNTSPSEAIADSRAIMEDWRSVGNDISTVIEVCESKQKSI